jgi:hypothetical protein
MHLARRAFALVAPLIIPSLLAAQTYPSKDDPRSKLKPGRLDADTVSKNMRLVSFTPKAAAFDTARGLTFINSDLAFGDKYVYQGNFSGFTVWDVSDPTKPKAVSAVSCVTSQGDPSIYGNLLFISAEGAGNRNDCAKGGVQDPKDHMAGVRIYDVSNPAAPKLVKNVQTCKGSHTHTIIPSKKDKNIIYIYVSGSQGASGHRDAGMQGARRSRKPRELAVPARRHQGLPRQAGEIRGRDGCAHLHGSRSGAACGWSSGSRSASARSGRYDDATAGSSTDRAAQLS